MKYIYSLRPIKFVGVLILLFSISLTTNAQYTLQSGDVTVNTSGFITNCNKSFAANEKDIIIPEKIDGITIKGIQDKSCYSGVFYNKGLTSVQFPSTIEYIGNNAFRESPLAGKLDFSNCNQLHHLGATVFYNCSLTEVDFSNCIRLTNIGHYAFSGNNLSGTLDLSSCTSLQSIDEYSFYHNQILKVIINSPALIRLGEYAFCRNAIAEVRLSGCNSLPNIEEAAFEKNKIASVDLSNCSALTTISKSAFHENKIASLNLNNCNRITVLDAYCFGNNKLTTIDFTLFPNLIWIGESAFNGNELTEVNLNGFNNLTTINNNAFSNNSITNVDLSNCSSLSKIGKYAFYSNQIATLNINNSKNITIFDDYSFNSNHLTTINLSQFTNLTHIGKGAFGTNFINENINLYNCTNLIHIGSNAFADNSSISGITLPNISQWISSKSESFNSGTLTTDLESSYYTYYTLTDSDVVVTDGAIVRCSYDFASPAIIIPENLDGQPITSIANSLDNSELFKQKPIHYIKFPSTISSIGSYAFYACPLQTIDISDCANLTSIKENAFANCSIESLEFSNCSLLNSIEAFAFNGCNVKTLNFNGCVHLKSIGRQAFYKNSIRSVTGLENCSKLKYIGNNAFGYNSELTTVIVANLAYSNEHKFVWASNGTYLQLNGNGKFELTDFSPSYSAAHTVIFKDYDGSLLKKDTVIYGATAIPPTVPNRTDYTFEGWNSDISNVSDTLSVVAQYIRNDADKYIFKVKSQSGKPAVFAKVAIGADRRYTNNSGIVTFPVIPEGCSFTISHELLYDDITGTIGASSKGTTILIDTLKTITLKIPNTDFLFTNGKVNVNDKSFAITSNNELEIFVIDGIYNYSFTHDNSLAPPINGIITIKGSDLTENLNLYTTNFSVKTVEDTLIKNATIRIADLNLTSKTNNTGSAFFYLPKGTYNYTLSHSLVGVEVNQNFSVINTNQRKDIILYTAEFIVKSDYTTPFSNALLTLGCVKNTTDSDGITVVYLLSGHYNYSVKHNNFGVDSILGSIDISDESITRNIDLPTTVFKLTTHTSGIENATIKIGNKTLTTNTNGTTSVFLPSNSYEAEISHRAFLKDYPTEVIVLDVCDTVDVVLSEAIFKITKTDGSPVVAKVKIGDAEFTAESDGKVNLFLPNGIYNYSVSNNDICGEFTGTIIVADGPVNENIIVYELTYNLTTANSDTVVNVSITTENMTIATDSSGIATFLLFPGTYQYYIPGLDTQDIVSIANHNEVVNISGLYKVLFIATEHECFAEPGIDITIGNSVVTTDPNGKACFYLAPDIYTYTANSSSHPGYKTGTIEVVNSGTTEKITLLVVRFVATANANPIWNAIIQLDEYNDSDYVTNMSGTVDIMDIFPGEYAYTVSHNNLLGNTKDTVTIEEYIADSIYIIKEYVDLSKTKSLTFNVTGNGVALKDALIRVDGKELSTDNLGQEKVVAMPGTYNYIITHPNHEGAIAGVVTVTEDYTININLLIASFTTNLCTINVNDTSYAGTTSFLLPKESHDYSIGMGSFFPITGTFTIQNNKVTQNLNLMNILVVDAENGNPVNNATMQYDVYEYAPQKENIFMGFLFDNGYENVFGFTAPGYRDTTLTIVTDLSDNITIELTPDISSYTVTFLDWDNTVLSSQTVSIGSTATTPENPVRQGYTFTAWDIDFTNVTSSLTATAQYNINTYMVTFKDWDETVLKTETVEYANFASEPIEPTRTGYTFTGWDIDFTNVTSNLIVTAQYSISTHVKEFEACGIGIYPNPASNTLTISINGIDQRDVLKNGIKILDLTGITVYKNTNPYTVQTIDISHFKNGIYFVHMGNEIIKVVKE